MEITSREILATVGGKLLNEASGADNPVNRLVIDSRDVSPGDFFIPLPGEKTDGHFYLADAARRGAAGCFVRAGYGGEIPQGLTAIEVDDPLLALQRLAKAYRRKFTLPVVAVTGSVGKTTTKDLIAAALSGKLKTLKTEGNLNNHIGLPIMLSRLRRDHEAAVLEMGMSGRGEIALLADLAAPRVGVITNIGESHLELLGSRENIACAKCELLSYLPPDGAAVVNADEELLDRHLSLCRAQVIRFGFTGRADLRCTGTPVIDGVKTVVLEQQGYPRAEFPAMLPGRHNVYNLMAAVAVARFLGLSDREILLGLKNCLRLTGMRLETVKIEPGITVINDAYNASPTSVKAALDTLGELAGEAGKIIVLGDMLELGDFEAEGHRQVGEMVAKLGGKALILLGERSRFIGEGAILAGFPADKVFHSATHQEAADRVKKEAGPGDWVLIKGSRGMRMEEVLKRLD